MRRSGTYSCREVLHYFQVIVVTGCAIFRPSSLTALISAWECVQGNGCALSDVQLYIPLQMLDTQRALCMVGHRSPRDQRKSDRARINDMRENNRLQIRFVTCSAFN